MNTIINPINNEKTKVSKQIFLDKMTWHEAIKACENLGFGWRLPTKYEIIEMYKNRFAIGGFMFDDYYWSLNEDENDKICIWLQGFENGSLYHL